MLWKLRVTYFQFLKPAVEKVVSARFKRLKRSSAAILQGWKNAQQLLSSQSSHFHFSNQPY